MRSRPVVEEAGLLPIRLRAKLASSMLFLYWCRRSQQALRLQMATMNVGSRFNACRRIRRQGYATGGGHIPQSWVFITFSKPIFNGNSTARKIQCGLVVCQQAGLKGM